MGSTSEFMPPPLLCGPHPQLSRIRLRFRTVGTGDFMFQFIVKYKPAEDIPNCSVTVGVEADPHGFTQRRKCRRRSWFSGTRQARSLNLKPQLLETFRILPTVRKPSDHTASRPHCIPATLHPDHIASWTDILRRRTALRSPAFPLSEVNAFSDQKRSPPRLPAIGC